MTGILKVDSIQNSGGTAAMTIDSGGRILTPARPSWRLGLSGNQSITTGAVNTVNFTDSTGTLKHLDGGCTLSGGKITVPVAGVYHASATLRMDSLTASDYAEMHIRHETTGGTITEIGYVISGTPSTTYENATASVTVKMAANEKLFVATYTADNSWTISSLSSFSGFLVG